MKQRRTSKDAHVAGSRDGAYILYYMYERPRRVTHATRYSIRW